MPLIAIGPKRKKPAWEWFGIDLANELRKYYDVKTFDRRKVKKIPADLILHVKAPGILEHSVKHAPTIFLPVDSFSEHRTVWAVKPWIKRCKHVIIHCHRLYRYFSKATYIEHHLKYYLTEDVEYKEKGFILWVGHPQDFIWVHKYLKVHGLYDFPLVFLTSDPNRLRKHYGKYYVDKWTPEKHLQCLRECKAAIDIKAKHFKHRYKPPTKVINYLASGVPVGVNTPSSASEHLADLGLPLLPAAKDGFLNYDYWQKIQNFKYGLRELCSLERIGLQYKEIIDEKLS